MYAHAHTHIPSVLYFCNSPSPYTLLCFYKFLPKISGAVSEMEVARKKLLSKPKPMRIQQKSMTSVHKVLKEKRLCRAQASVNSEEKGPERKSNLKRKTDGLEIKLMDSAREVPEKRSLMENIQEDRASAQQIPERKLALKQKPVFVEKPATSANGEGRLIETKNHQKKIVNGEVCLKSSQKIDDKKRKLLLRIKLPLIQKL